MKIVLPGGTGQVGTMLARAFVAAGHDVVVLSRTPRSAPWRVVPWDAASVGPWIDEIDGADAVINLAGRSVNCRYTPANRRLIMESRVNSTRAVGKAIARSKRPPRVWLQASTATIYAHRYDAQTTKPPGSSAARNQVCRTRGASASTWRRRGNGHWTKQQRPTPAKWLCARR